MIKNEDLKKRILSKIEEGYAKGGKLIESGEVSLYPEPAPSVDPTVIGSGKILQVDSDLLRDLLNWATSADAGSIDAVVSKAEELGVSSPLSPEHLIELTATAQTADPSNATVCDGIGGDIETSQAPSTVVPAGPVGPLSPVMASFLRRGKKVNESLDPGEDPWWKKPADYSKQNHKGHPEPSPEEKAASRQRQDAKTKAAFDKIDSKYGKLGEDDIIDSDHEVITSTDQMGDKNDGIDSEGGETLPNTTKPIGKLNSPNVMGAPGLEEDEIEDGVEDAASAIADGITDGLSDGDETETDVNALPGERIPQDDDDSGINAEVGAPIAPPMGGEEGGDGLVSQVAALNARVAELEALLGGSETSEVPPSDEVEISGEDDEDGEEDELSINGDDSETDSEDEDTEDDSDDSEESSDDEDKENDADSDEEDDESEDDDDTDEKEDGKEVLLGGDKK
jgi:hypothetical protein